MVEKGIYSMKNANRSAPAVGSAAVKAFIWRNRELAALRLDAVKTVS